MARIKVPAALTGADAEEVEVDGDTVGEVLRRHAADHGDQLRSNVVEDGQINEYINVYVNGEEVAHLQGLEPPVDDDDLLRVIPAASGG